MPLFTLGISNTNSATFVPWVRSWLRVSGSVRSHLFPLIAGGGGETSGPFSACRAVLLPFLVLVVEPALLAPGQEVVISNPRRGCFMGFHEFIFFFFFLFFFFFFSFFSAGLVRAISLEPSLVETPDSVCCLVLQSNFALLLTIQFASLFFFFLFFSFFLPRFCPGHISGTVTRRDSKLSVLLGPVV